MLKSLSRLSAILLCVVVRVQAQPTIQPIAVEHVNVVDVIAGEIRGDQTVLISNGRINVTGAAATVTPLPDARVISAQGKYLLPGLWDMHVHLRGDPSKPDVGWWWKKNRCSTSSCQTQSWGFAKWAAISPIR
jgi:imidazolonepropionase-like amidohydrolase